MPSPVYAPGGPGNLINGVPVAAARTIAAFLDLSACFEGQVTCEVVTRATPPSTGTVFSAYKVYGNATPNTIQGPVSAGATSISLNSKAGINPNQKIALQQAGGSKLGEVVTVGTAAITGTGPYTVPVSNTINSYSVNDPAYLVAQQASAAAAPASPSGSWAATTDYSAPLTLPAGQWVVAANNTDGTYSVTVSASVDKITAIA